MNFLTSYTARVSASVSSGWCSLLFGVGWLWEVVSRHVNTLTHNMFTQASAECGGGSSNVVLFHLKT